MKRVDRAMVLTLVLVLLVGAVHAQLIPFGEMSYVNAELWFSMDFDSQIAFVAGMMAGTHSYAIRLTVDYDRPLIYEIPYGIAVGEIWVVINETYKDPSNWVIPISAIYLNFEKYRRNVRGY